MVTHESRQPAANEATPRGDLLLEQLPERLRAGVVALQAEEHYTRIYTEKGEALVLMRFRDAVNLVSELDGVRTHLSYWVNPAYVSRYVRAGRASRVHLTTGIDIPVSRSYRLRVAELLGDH